MLGQTVQTQIRLLLIRVYTVCCSVCIVWTHYSMVEPHSSYFRVITTNFLGVGIFRKIYGHPKKHGNHPKMRTVWLYCRVMHPKDADRMANSVHPDQRSSLIWVYTVCPDLAVWKLWKIMVHFSSFPAGLICTPSNYKFASQDHLVVYKRKMTKANLCTTPPGRSTPATQCSTPISWELWLQIEPRHEKTCLQGLQPGKTQTNLLSYRDKLESWNFVVHIWLKQVFSSCGSIVIIWMRALGFVTHFEEVL